MTRQEVDGEISRVLRDLMKLVFNKKKHRDRQSRKKGYPDEVSSYEVEGVMFWVYYFFDNGADATTIFCKYYDRIGVVYTYVSIHNPSNINTLHFIKHSINQYTDRLGLGLINAKTILFHMAKNGMVMIRQDTPSNIEGKLKVGWKSQNGLWLGDFYKSTKVSTVNTFIHNNLVRLDQEAVLNEDALEKLITFEQDIGDDDYARRWTNRLIELFK